MIARKKRTVWVSGAPIDLGEMNLWEFIDPQSYGACEVYGRAIRKLDKRLLWYGFENLMVNYCWSIVNTEIEYRGDTEQFRRVDWWQLPSECWFLRKGDCEDTTFLLTSAASQFIEDPRRFFGVIGYYYDGQYWGHAYCLYWNTYFKRWCVIETTWDSEIPPTAAYTWNPNRYIPAVIFNRKYIGTILMDDPQKTLGLDKSYVETRIQVIRLMLDYITQGKKLDFSFRHKTVRPVPMREPDLTATKKPWWKRFL